jgi:hypothetical protein
MSKQDDILSDPIHYAKEHGSGYTDSCKSYTVYPTPDRGAPMDGKIGSGRMPTPKLFRPMNEAAKPNVYPHPVTKKFWGPV